MRFSTLHEWLYWQESLHPSEIELGLERIQQVWQSLGHGDFTCPVITVAGTNGKGSCITMLQAIYQAAGYHVASYTSPHLWHYNERIRLDGKPVADNAIVAAFDLIDQRRGNISLTYFEFGTLAALHIFASVRPDIVLLEVGLGGRLDAVNIINADVALITSIDLDHQSYLGETRELIATEKAGILRAAHPCVLADPAIPTIVDDLAARLGSPLYRCGQEYRYEITDGQWQWYGPGNDQDILRSGLPLPAISGQHQVQNAAAVLMVTELLKESHPVNQQAIRQGLLSAHIAGRFEIRQESVTVIYDVAHNAAAAGQLASNLRSYAGQRRIIAVFSILADKDIEAVIAPLLPLVSHWFVAPVKAPRAASTEQMMAVLNKHSASVWAFHTVAQAKQEALHNSEESDLVLVFGSFYTVAEAVAETGAKAV